MRVIAIETQWPITIRPESMEDAALLRSVAARQKKTDNPAVQCDSRTGAITIIPTSVSRGDYTIVSDIKRFSLSGQTRLINLLTSLAWEPRLHKTHEW